MARKPSYQGSRSSPQAITQNDGTWPLPEGLAREQAAAPPEPLASAPVAALRGPVPARQSTAAPAFPRPPRPARPADLSPALQSLWREVLDRHDALARLDHFAVLGIPYEAGGSQVQAAFGQLIARLHPDKLPNELELLRPYAVRIAARLNVAHMMLSTRRDREAYLRSLGRPVPPPSVAPPAPGKVLARVRPERRPVPKPAAAPSPAPEELGRSKRVSRPPTAGARLLRALRRERPSSG